VRWRGRDTRRGGRFVSATFSDSSGQFQASCFDEEGCKLLARLHEEGECALLSVELDRQPGEETPRVTVRGVTPFARVASAARLRMVLTVETPEAIAPLAAMLTQRRGGRSAVEIHAMTAAGEARVRVGNDFQLDSELAERIETIAGIRSVALTGAGPRLALVSSR